MKKFTWIILVIGAVCFAGGFGWSNQSESKYDQQISKYDIGLNSFKYKYVAGADGCEELALKEREAIVSDIKSGRFHMKKHPEFKGIIYLSGNFASDKEYVYYDNLSICTKHNRDAIIDIINHGNDSFNVRQYRGF